MDGDEGQAFTIPDWWKLSEFTLPNSVSEATLFGALDFDLPSTKLDNPYAPNKSLEQSLQLPNLDAFTFGPLPDLEQIDDLSISDSEHTDTAQSLEEDDIWKIALELGPLENDVKYYTWESFVTGRTQEPCSAYISDSGAELFDAVLEAKAKETDATRSAGTIVHSKIHINSLLALGLGLESVLFSWSTKSKSFIETIQDVRTTGFSLQSMQDLTRQLLKTGNIARSLRASTEIMLESSKTFPARVALASSINTALDAIERHLFPKVVSVESLLQLKRLFERPHTLLLLIKEMASITTTAKTDVQLASTLFRQLQTFEQEEGMLRLIMLQFVARVCGPSLELICAWTGLGSSGVDQNWSAMTNTFFEIEEKPSDQESKCVDEYSYQADAMPSFISEDDGQMIFEIGKSIRLLQHHHPRHPLSDPDHFGITPPGLEWEFDWDCIEVIQSKVNQYESAITSAILDSSTCEQAKTGVEFMETCRTKEFSLNGITNNFEDFAKGISDTISRLDGPPEDVYALPDELRQLIISYLDNDHNTKSNDSIAFAPPTSFIPILSFQPFFITQARLVHAATLRLLFRSHNLRMHLSLQRNYHLLGDGVFVSRLTSALFDPDLSSAERQRGSLRLGTSMGLRLTGRNTWPPASSELRLALMGMLSETYTSSSLSRNSKPTGKEAGNRDSTPLPGDLSFAIRNLSSEDIEKCMNPHSLHALDFLRLQYTPPSPLHTILPPAAMEKYDVIFKFLLRLTRMLFVVSHLPRNAKQDRRLRTEAHHFVSCCASYFFDSVRETWDAFERYLDEIEAAIAVEDKAGVLGRHVTEGIESLHAKHERVLDQISFKLLLRGRQRQVMALLEEIFGVVLEFASEPEASERLYGMFKEKVQLFMTVCRGLVGKKGYGKTKTMSGGEEENTIDRLVLLLEMSGYYTSDSTEDMRTD